jgi:catechol 2,3-dioxygenase-like lactoylglutathione lyase family enzyme
VIERRIGAVFVPVSNIEAARDWYCRLLGVSEMDDIQFGHIFVVPMREDSALVLDSMDFSGPHDRKPLFHFKTDDIEASRRQVIEHGAREVGPISNRIFFTFKDPDGNLLMVANVPSAPKG